MDHMSTFSVYLSSQKNTSGGRHHAVTTFCDMSRMLARCICGYFLGSIIRRANPKSAIFTT